MSKRLIIGITGGSGSGKTLFLKQLMEKIGEERVTLLSMDNYYLPKQQQQKDENDVENFDLPQSIDRSVFYSDLVKLKNGETIKLKEYTFNFRDIESKILTLKSLPVIIVEGIFTFYFSEILGLMDLKLFIDTPDYLMLKRRITRDANERGYDINDVLYRFEHHVMPSFTNYILPLKDQADLIIPNHANFDNALNVIYSYVDQYTSE
jgi:uridine kinase